MPSPGFESIFRSPLQLEDRWSVTIPPLDLARALKEPPRRRFASVVGLYAEGVAKLAKREMGPNVVVCSLSDGVLRECYKIVREDA